MRGLWITADEIESFPTIKGAYLLVSLLDQTVEINLPGVADTRLTPGWYLYAGSAKGGGGIRARVRRHFRHDKKAHWHIDRLTARAARITALAIEDGQECHVVERLLKSRHFEIAAAGFGSSDCRSCQSHLLMPAPS